MTTFDPGVQPNSRNPASKCSCWRKASPGGGLPGERTPTRGVLGRCASTASGASVRLTARTTASPISRMGTSVGEAGGSLAEHWDRRTLERAQLLRERLRHEDSQPLT